MHHAPNDVEYTCCPGQEKPSIFITLPVVVLAAPMDISEFTYTELRELYIF